MILRRVAHVVGLFVIVIAVTVSARPAAAHAILLQTAPANEALIEEAPDSVELEFSEAVRASTGGVTVFGPDGDRVDRGSVTRSRGGEVIDVGLDAGAPGTYTVAWRVTSEDGHTITGAFIFHVQRKTGAVEIDDSKPASVVAGGYIGRWLIFAGSLVVIGALAVRRLAGAALRDERRLRLLAAGAAGSAATGAAVALLSAAAEAGDGYADSGDGDEERFGAPAGYRTARSATAS